MSRNADMSFDKMQSRKLPAAFELIGKASFVPYSDR